MTLINNDMLSLRAMFQASGFDIRLVGGAVRDLIRGQDPKDIDFCTDAFPDEQLAIYKTNKLQFIPTGVEHGTYTVVMNGAPYEITSLRTESEHDGRHAKMTFTRDWVDDLSRRDLTVNAMAMTFDGELLDPFNGVRDLQTGTVRFVGDASCRMREDYLRILRYFRFLGRVGHPSQIGSYVVTPEVKSALLDNVQGLENISVERIWSETKKILSHKTGPAIYHAMHSHGVCHHTGLPIAYGQDQYDAMVRVRKFTDDPVVILCALMDSTGYVQKVAAALKWSKEERQLGIEIVSMRDMNWDEINYQWIVKGVDTKHLAQVLLYQGQPYAATWITQAQAPVFPVTGVDLLNEGMTPGPTVGGVLTRLKDQWFHSGCQLTKDELLALI
jgi:tRNA nucleotidyltransferase/poly(A) polymerase